MKEQEKLAQTVNKGVQTVKKGVNWIKWLIIGIVLAIALPAIITSCAESFRNFQF